MAHYENFAARGIDYSNRQLFEGLFDFILHPKSAWQAYWQHHLPAQSGVQTLNPSDDPPKTRWKYLAFFHYVGGFLFRLLMLPVTSMIYTLSRTFLIVLNPFTAWRNNPWKASLMASVWAIPLFLAFNNHAYSFIPDFSFSTLLTLDNFRDVSGAFSLPKGAGVIHASTMGGLIVSTFLSIAMACSLHVAKKIAQTKNGFKMEDPRQVNPFDPANIKTKNGNKEFELQNIKTNPDSVLITSPKHRPANVSNHENLIFNDYKDYNAASNNLRYAYYQQKKPAIWGDAPKRVKRLLNAFDAVNKTHGTDKFEVEAIKLKTAYLNLIDLRVVPDKVSLEMRKQYRIDATLDQYAVDFERHVFKKAGTK